MFSGVEQVSPDFVLGQLPSALNSLKGLCEVSLPSCTREENLLRDHMESLGFSFGSDRAYVIAEAFSDETGPSS